MSAHRANASSPGPPVGRRSRVVPPTRPTSVAIAFRVRRRKSVPTVSVVIRALNESRLIGRCLDALVGQEGSFDLEIVVVDNGSTDSTREIARDFGARVLEIAREEFDYSTALNLGIAHAKGELVVILSAHAIPRESNWLQRMTEPFDDPLVAGVCARQVAWPDSDPVEAHRIARAFADVPRMFEARDGRGLVFSNSASCIRRSVWEDDPFALPFAEDLHWAARAIEAGWRIVYEPRASVIHSHDDTARRFAKRLIDMSRAADAASGRTRTPARHLREAAGFAARRLREVWLLELSSSRRLTHACKTVLIAVWFLVGFRSRS